MELKTLIKNPKLPSLPEVFLKLNELVNNSAPFKEIAAVIVTDTSLSARTLELANSAWYGQQRKIASIDLAVTTIGTAALQQLVLATSITRLFQGIEVKAIDLNTFWQQSLTLACHAQTVASKVSKKDAIRLFSCGILCGIGKLVLYISEPNIASNILRKCEERKIPQYVIENEVLGFNHSDISAALLKEWLLPSNLYSPIQYYLYPSKQHVAGKQDSSMLNVAHYIQSELGQLADQITPFDQEVNAALKLTGLEQTEFLNIRDSAQKLYANSASLLGL